jgi:hypothetical protein
MSLRAMRSIVVLPYQWWAARALVLVALSACAASVAASLPEEYLGRWYYLGSSGGITGAGMGDEARGYIVIHSDNQMDHHEEGGTLVGTTEFTVGRGRTIFSSEDQWILSRDPSAAEVITVSEDGQSMSLSESVYDGFVRAYARSR